MATALKVIGWLALGVWVAVVACCSPAVAMMLASSGEDD